jgi:hypothetical protein
LRNSVRDGGLDAVPTFQVTAPGSSVTKAHSAAALSRASHMWSRGDLTSKFTCTAAAVNGEHRASD